MINVFSGYYPDSGGQRTNSDMIDIQLVDKLTSSKRRWTEIYLPLLFALRSFIFATKDSPRLNIGLENLKAS